MNRLFLYSGFLFILILIFDAYDRDYNQPQVSSTNIIENSATNDSKQPPQTDTIKRARLMVSVCGGCLESFVALFSIILVDETCGWL